MGLKHLAAKHFANKSAKTYSLVGDDEAQVVTRGGGGKIRYIGQFSGRDPEKLKKIREDLRRKKQNAAILMLLH
jgi:DNA-directed RNA polymerase subunit F